MAEAEQNVGTYEGMKKRTGQKICYVRQAAETAEKILQDAERAATEIEVLRDSEGGVDPERLQRLRDALKRHTELWLMNDDEEYSLLRRFNFKR